MQSPISPGNILRQETRGRQAVYNNKGQLIGWIEGQWLVKRGLCYDRHHLHRYRAWATDTKHIEQLKVITYYAFR